jgi:long-chain acyl-CoA synthetase
MAMITDLFHLSAAAHSDRTAVSGHRLRLTYGQLRSEALRLAQELRRLGATPGDRVAVLLPNSAEAAVAVWAVLEAGCVLVPLHVAARSDALLPVLRTAEPKCLLAAAELTALVRSVADVPAMQVLLIGAAAHGETQWPTWRIAATAIPATDQAASTKTNTADDLLAALIFTSGSTGEPKGVMVTHANMQAALRSVLAYLPLAADDILYSALPLSSSYGLYQLLMGLVLGATVVLDRSFSFPANSLSLLAAQRATVFAGVPTMFAWLASTPLLANYDLSCLRILTSAAAALPVQHARQVCERLPHARLYVMYGQTECKRISYLHPDDLDRKPGSVGRGMPYQEHALVDAAGTPVPADTVGELVVRGAHVMQGYWRSADETARKLRPLAAGPDIWLHTDDLFRMDTEGYLYYVGRRDDILKIGGNKVSPREVEEVLCQMPEIAEAAVVGMADELWGQAARAHVVLKEGTHCTAEDVIRFCMPRLRGFMVPKAVVFAKTLPKTESGKIKKRDLVVSAK